MNASWVSSSLLGVYKRSIRVYSIALLGAALLCSAQQTKSDPDILVLSNGDVLHGKLVNEIGGKVTFHTDPLGDISVPWSKMKELHASEKFAVVDKTVKLRGKKPVGQFPVGTVDVANEAVEVHADKAPASLPVGNAAYIVDEQTLNRQAFHEPSFRSGWNGAATAGATIVHATQNQETFSGSVGLVRTVPSVTWLNKRNRTSTDFSGSFGKITEPGTPSIKTAIFHADAERDEYVSPRFFAMAETAFDHNFAQRLALQSVYGGGLGYTAFSMPKFQLDLKAAVQYESQQFLATAGATATTPNQNLIASTFSLNYIAKWKLVTYTQEAAFVPAYNTPRAYSANEADTLAFPAYKNFSFSMGTLDSYLNDPPTSVPPTKHNSFQFTMGLTYAIKSKF